VPTYRQLDQAAIIATIEALRDRITARFPQSNLRRVSEQLLEVAGEVSTTVAYLRRPNWLIRVGGAVVIIGLVALLIAIAGFTLNTRAELSEMSEVVQTIEAAVNDVVFFGIAVYFVLTLETRVKRKRALAVLHELRSLAHIVDMHQLTKDPERLMATDPPDDTAQRRTTGTDLAKYLDFCSELLSLSSKLAALTVQHFNDDVVLAAVNEIETLSTGLAGRIWQKITILDRTIAPSATS
jgi:hypothetical protein